MPTSDQAGRSKRLDHRRRRPTAEHRLSHRHSSPAGNVGSSASSAALVPDTGSMMRRTRSCPCRRWPTPCSVSAANDFPGNVIAARRLLRRRSAYQEPPAATGTAAKAQLGTRRGARRIEVNSCSRPRTRLVDPSASITVGGGDGGTPITPSPFKSCWKRVLERFKRSTGSRHGIDDGATRSCPCRRWPTPCMVSAAIFKATS